MPIPAPSFRQRERAESFGAVAAEYDRYRPSYPPQLVDDLLREAPADGDGRVRVLDVGCGTGKAARLFSARGADVLGVEIDPQMAAVARSHGLDVEVSGFEDWDDRGRTFGLITSAQAWHWVDPAVADPKAARLLDPGGLVALFWNFDELDATTHAVIDPVYARFAPELDSSVVTAGARHSRAPQLTDLRASGAFASVSSRVYRWQRVLPAADWVAMVGTHSDHLLIGDERRSALQRELLRVLRVRGGDEVRTSGGTLAVLGRV